LPWKFDRVPDGFWDSDKNGQDFMNWANSELKIEAPDDWYKVPEEHIFGNIFCY
jgi:hypothetical protein